jgi:hypothetical protein
MSKWTFLRISHGTIGDDVNVDISFNRIADFLDVPRGTIMRDVNDDITHNLTEDLLQDGRTRLGSKSPPLATIPRLVCGEISPEYLQLVPNFAGARTFGGPGPGDCYREVRGIPIWRCSRLPQAVKSRSDAAR